MHLITLHTAALAINLVNYRAGEEFGLDITTKKLFILKVFDYANDTYIIKMQICH
jgi:hypothetical protein